ncbi:MAG TPA: hypothetical protein VGR00_01585 [Thermoanaerobaculia bacterium]|nr:hypothetical protein [Thermoanaerobaculia bacterium]
MSACGRKLAPEAPLQVIPARVEPVRLVQEGSDVVVRFPYPTKTAQGEPLSRLTKVTVYRDILPAPEGAAPPPAPENGAARDREEKLFKTRASVVKELSRSDLDESAEGGDVVVRDPLVPLYYEKRIGRVFLRYGVTATRDVKRVSELSPFVAIRPRVPPERPLGLVATVEESRVCLDWIPPIAMLDGSRAVKVAGYAVYRRERGEEAYDAPLSVALNGPFAIDETVATGKKYLYTVRAAPTRDLPLVLGPPADEVLVDTTDVFPPPPPEGLLVLSEEGANRLVWNPVLVKDLDFYRVYRFDEGAGRFVKFGEKIKEPTALDSGAKSTARYAVTAVDLSGNESAPAEAVGGRK